MSTQKRGIVTMPASTCRTFDLCLPTSNWHCPPVQHDSIPQPLGAHWSWTPNDYTLTSASAGRTGGWTGTGNGQACECGQMGNMGRWASGPASECGQVSEWVGEWADERVWAGEQAGEWAGRLGLRTGMWASMGRWASIGRWASGPASKCGLEGKWAGGWAGQLPWAGERAGEWVG